MEEIFFANGSFAMNRLYTKYKRESFQVLKISKRQILQNHPIYVAHLFVGSPSNMP
jgi:hypothetical protein